jgi:hypothetical protein
MMAHQPPREVIWLLGAVALLAAVFGVGYLVGNVTGLFEDGGSISPTIPPPISLRIVEPANNATVSSPVTLQVASSGVEIAAPEQGVEGAVHYSAFVDIHPFTPGGQVVPDDEPGIYSFATEVLELDLQPGKHTIIVALADNDNVRLPAPAPAVFVDITVTD